MFASTKNKVVEGDYDSFEHVVLEKDLGSLGS